MLLPQETTDLLARLGARQPSASQTALLVAYRVALGASSYRTLSGFMAKSEALTTLARLVQDERERSARLSDAPRKNARQLTRYLVLDLVAPDFLYFRLWDSQGIQLTTSAAPAPTDILVPAVIPPMAPPLPASPTERVVAATQAAATYKQRLEDGTLGL